MTVKELAEKLNGREYGNEITKQEEKEAKQAGLVVIFGYSDDNAKVRGAAYDEIGCYGGGEIFFTPFGILANDCDEEDCPYFAKLKLKAKKVEIKTGAFWAYATEIPHETFEIMEDDEVYCIGIVFSLSDVK